MVAFPGVAPDAFSEQVPIETMRGIAVLMLVSYHVVGPAPGTALDVSYPHPLRLYADFFVDLRMPFFAFIAGYIYALRPASQAHYAEFVAGKLRRLYLPGALAITAFAVSANLLGNRFSVAWGDIWYVVLHSYAHFWFLQAILVIFVVFGLLDALLQRRLTGHLLLVSFALYLSNFHFGTRFFSVDSAMYLLPFFLLGVFFNRHAAEFARETARLTVLLALIGGACVLWNAQVYLETGAFSLYRRDVQSLGFGIAACTLAMLWLPRLPALERLSPYAFTIYLYHVFGTSGSRMLCDSLGVTALEPRFFCGVLGGLVLPVVIHKAAAGSVFPTRLILGR